MSYVKNTWKTGDLITSDKLNNLESGTMFTNDITFTDFATVAANLNNFVGRYYNPSVSVIANSPSSDQYQVIDVLQGSPTGRNGKIIVYCIKTNDVFVGNVDSGSIQSWTKLAKYGETLNLTGDQTVTGNKSFTGNVSIAGSVMNYATIPSVSITGYVSGLLKVSKQSGMVSITSMDLVLTKGAKVTLPAGYYPRTQLQAPITGQNTAGTTAGGYMTIGVDGSVTFNSMGFASGNATAYVNVHYIAQV